MSEKELCPFCGSGSRNRCDYEFVSGVIGIECQWEDELYPDLLKEDRDEKQHIDRMFVSLP